MNEILLLLFILNNILTGSALVDAGHNLTQASAAAPKPIFRLGNFKLKKELTLSNPTLESLTATNILIKEIGGSVLFDRQAQQPRPIASITKLITALVAYTTYPETEKFKISPEAVSVEGENGAFKIGEILGRDDLIKAALVGSSNDASFALAQKTGVSNFIQLMNAKAQELGLAQTHFVDSIGLSSRNVSSLSDLAQLADYLIRNYPEVIKWSAQSEVNLPGRSARKIVNLNYLLPIYSNYIVGSKTGFTNDAGECLILILKFEKSPFIFLGLLNSKNRFQDAEKLILTLKNFYE